MMITVLTLLLLSAEPGPSPQPGPSLAVVSTSVPGLEKVAAEAGRTLGTRLEAPYVDLGSYLKSRSGGCQNDLRCLVSAPGLSASTRLLHLRLRLLSGGRLAADLRLIDLRAQKVIGRSASVVESGELAGWTERASNQLLTRADPYSRNPPPSPFVVKPTPEKVPATKVPATPRPAAPGAK
jgi:hypothetical protein